MGNRKLFPKYPAEWEQHPQVLSRRVGAIEDHLETSNVTSQASWLPTVALLLVNLLGVLGLLSPEKVADFTKLLGH